MHYKLQGNSAFAQNRAVSHKNAQWFWQPAKELSKFREDKISAEEMEEDTKFHQ